MHETLRYPTAINGFHLSFRGPVEYFSSPICSQQLIARMLFYFGRDLHATRSPFLPIASAISC